MRWRVRSGRRFPAVQVGAVTLCDLDIDGDGSLTVARDGTLLLRYLMVSGNSADGWFALPMPTRRRPSLTTLGLPYSLTCLRRERRLSATVDGPTLLRLMPECRTTPLNGIAATVGRTIYHEQPCRANVNGKRNTILKHQIKGSSVESRRVIPLCSSRPTRRDSASAGHDCV